MLICDHFPELNFGDQIVTSCLDQKLKSAYFCTHLIATLAQLTVDNFTHFVPTSQPYDWPVPLQGRGHVRNTMNRFTCWLALAIRANCNVF